ncbi:MAG: pentapeptide repeat-containing protein [Candidatus Cloacimonetes bacterium]|nr:pentapeptide repeat-containing protein [Candidatus Cloacimonadota bacterium]
MSDSEVFLDFDNRTFTELSPDSTKSNDFFKCLFKSCDLTDFHFDGILDTCTFEECNLSLTSFKHSKLQGVKFLNCKLLGINFTECSPLGLALAFKSCMIRSCNFNYLDLSKTVFSGCNIFETDFIGTNLTGSNFSYSEFQNVTFHNTILINADFTNAHEYQINPLSNQIKNAKFSLPDAVSLLSNMGVKLS